MNMSGAPAPQQVGRYGDVMKIETTGASAATARQDGNNEIFGIPASFELAKTDLERMDKYRDIIIKVGRETGVDPAVIAGIISRASRAGSAYVMVDGWNFNRDTFGLMQIAKQWHTLKGDWNSEEHIKQGTRILTSSIEEIKKRFPKWTMEQQLKGGIAAYCAGPQNVPADYEKVDENTFAKDYSNDVVARAQFYRGQGFHLCDVDARLVKPVTDYDVGRYGDVMKIETTGASAATARQDGNNEIFGIPASFELAKTDLERMDKYRDTIIKVGRETGVDPAVIAGIISRASRAGSAYVMVDGWNFNRDTFGLMQIAKQWHTLKGDWNSEEHIKQGTRILTSSIEEIKKRFPKWTMEQQLKGGIAAYCAGPQNVPADYEKVDENTFAKDYSNDVVARAQFYRGQGFHLCDVDARLVKPVTDYDVGRYGDVMKIETTGASAATARQDGNNEIFGIPASFELAKTDLERMDKYRDTIIKVGRETGVDPAVIAGIISRASRAGSAYVMVDGWNFNRDTFGLMQIAKQWHTLKGDWNSEEHIKQGTRILTSSIEEIKKRFPKWTMEQQLKGGIAAYCAGPQNVPADYEKVDENTFAKDYSNDVVARAQFYRGQGFHLCDVDARLVKPVTDYDVGRYGDVMKIETTGASAATARQDGNNEIFGIPASFELAKTDLERMDKYRDTIIKVGRETGVDPAVIAGIISRASRAGSAYVMVDGWNFNRDTFGLMQIAKQWHTLKGDWNSEEHIKQGTRILTSSIEEIKKRFPKWTMEQQLKGGIAAYCAGPQNVPADYEKVDENTFAKDYSNDVVARAQFYRGQGFHLCDVDARLVKPVTDYDVGRYGDVMKIETTGASAATARQDGNNEIFGIPASFELAKTDLERMDKYRDTIIKVGRETGVDPAVIAGIISRASRAGSAYVMVDGWNFNRDTFGLMQIAKQWHTLKGDWNSEEHIKQGTRILTSSIEEIKKRFPKWTMEQQLKGGIAAYCAGPQNVPADYEKVDENTFAKDYSNDVVARAQFYRGQGFHL